METEANYEVTDVVPVGQPFLVNVQASLDAWQAYQKLCQVLLDEADYANIKGRKARKRSGWAKLRRFMNVTADIREERFVELDGDWGFEFIVRATGPDGRYEDGDGSCFHSELASSGSIAPTRHNVRAKALTRAKNRATADLIGGGEVSAEELEGGDDEPRKRPRKPAAKTVAANGTTRPAPATKVREWLTAKAEQNASTRVPSDAQLGLLNGKIGEALQDNDDKPRHLVLDWLWGRESSKQLTYGEVDAMLSWLIGKKDEDTGDYPFKEHAVPELLAIKRQAEQDVGQADLFGKEAA